MVYAADLDSRVFRIRNRLMIMEQRVRHLLPSDASTDQMKYLIIGGIPEPLF